MQEDKQSYERSQGKAVKEDIAQDIAFVPIPLGRGAGNDNALVGDLISVLYRQTRLGTKEIHETRDS